jgi:hypothetical protein
MIWSEAARDLILWYNHATFLKDIRKLQEFLGIISGLRYKSDKGIDPIKIKRAKYHLRLEISGKFVCQLTDIYYLAIKSRKYKEDMVEIRIRFLVDKIITSLLQNAKLL